MIWSTWRQHRPEALSALAILAVLAAAIVYIESTIGIARAASGEVQDIQIALFVLPALVGVFIGAPLLTRDLEQGTHRLVWTQGTTRSSWLRAKFLLVFAAVATGAALLGAVMTAAILRSSLHVDHWYWFDFLLPAFAAYVLFALALGLAVGAVIGRTYPAMALTLVLFIAARAVVEGILRPRFMAPMRVGIDNFGTLKLPADAVAPWFVGDRYFDAGGHELSIDDVLGLLNHQQGQTSLNLAAHGLIGWAYYQPDWRFWPFQAIETAIFLGLTAALVGLAYYWASRRVT